MRPSIAKFGQNASSVGSRGRIAGVTPERGHDSDEGACHLTHKSATWAEICVTRAKLAKICVKFPLDFRFKLALRRALRRIAKVLYRPSAYD